MIRPWQVWLLFLLCLVTVAVAMTRLTVKVVELDRAEATATARADLEEEISLALWRMDSLVTPLLAEEAMRSYHEYLPEITSATGQEVDAAATPSSLLTDTPQHVVLHFQCTANNENWSSPQNPIGVACQVAIASGVSPQTIGANADLLQELRKTLGEVELVDQLAVPQGKGLRDDDIAWRNTVGSQILYSDAQEQEADDSDTPGQQSTRRDLNLGYGGYGQLAEKQSHSRGQREFSNRFRVMQSYGQKAVALGRQSDDRQLDGVFQRVTEGVSQPLWVGQHLLFARRVIVDDVTLVQGCWLDWPRIKKMLLAEARHLPGADLVAVREYQTANPARMLASLPVRLIADQRIALPAPWSPIRFSLLLAWACLLMATLAVGALLLGVIRLSERRGAFVSAVTHELRTPLTTFRMYAEMLAEDMVPEPEKRKHYLQTLRAEADRLWHLVENVLSYARLERGRRNGGREHTTVQSLVDRAQSRLSERARQSGMQLSIDVAPEAGKASLIASVTVVEQILFNLVDNACKYAANADNPRIEVTVNADASAAEFCVRDHGPGISRGRMRRLFRPFSKSAEEAADSAPGIGLGLALCQRLARDLGGQLKLRKVADGAAFVLRLPLS